MYNYKRYSEIRQHFAENLPIPWLFWNAGGGRVRFRLGFGTVASMGVKFSVSLVELKRAFRRLSARLPDESEADGEFVVFTACDDKLEITANGTSEGLSASGVHPGRASVPFPVFRGMARILRFYPLKVVRLALSAGVLTFDRTAFRHKDISILPRSVSEHQSR
jgi:hypothetical protein